MADQYTADAAALKENDNARLFHEEAGLYQHTDSRPNVFPLDANINVVKNGVAPGDKVQHILDYSKDAGSSTTARSRSRAPSMTDPYGHTIEPLNNYWEMVARLRSNDAAGALDADAATLDPPGSTRPPRSTRTPSREFVWRRLSRTAALTASPTHGGPARRRSSPRP